MWDEWRGSPRWAKYKICCSASAAADGEGEAGARNRWALAGRSPDNLSAPTDFASLKNLIVSRQFTDHMYNLILAVMIAVA